MLDFAHRLFIEVEWTQNLVSALLFFAVNGIHLIFGV